MNEADVKLVNDYLALVKKTMKPNPAAEDIAAVEHFEDNNPEVVDLAYKAAGPLVYDPVSGKVYEAEA